jgi:hypothetical protein
MHKCQTLETEKVMEYSIAQDPTIHNRDRIGEQEAYEGDLLRIL